VAHICLLLANAGSQVAHISPVLGYVGSLSHCPIRETLCHARRYYTCFVF
jgi:hypothetical protein